MSGNVMNVGALLRECTRSLEARGNDNAGFEAQQLLMKLCGVTRNDMLLFPGLAVTEQQADALPAGRFPVGIPASRCNISSESGSSTGCRSASARECSFPGRTRKPSWTSPGGS